jgi:CHAT domain-containing protein/Tfp pilus assembly protein PilF
MMIDMRSVGKVLLVAALLAMGFPPRVEAAPENEQSWILLEQGRPEEALARCVNRSDMLSVWIVARAEMRLGTGPSDESPASQSARAFESGDYAQAFDLLENLLADAAAAEDILHLRLRLGACLVELGRIPEAEEILTEAIEQAQEEKRLASECYGLLTRGRARVRLRQVEPPREDLQASLALSRRLETPRWSGVAAIALSVVSRLQMDLDDALHWREAALEYYRHAGDLPGQARALHYIATIGIMQGELTEAMHQLQDAAKLARQANGEAELGGILGEMAAINYLLGDFDRALDQYNEAVRLAPNPWRRGMMLVNIGSIHEFRGQFDLALPALEEALELMRQVGDHRSETTALQSLGEALCEMEQCERGLEYLDDAIKTSREFGIPLSEASALEIKGQCLLKMGKLTEAAETFEAAIKLAEGINYFDVLEWALLGRAQVARQSGNPEKALQLMRTALAEVSDVRRRSGGSSQMAGGIVKQAGGIYEEMIDLLYEMHQADQSVGYHQQAFNVAQEARARSFLDLMAEAEYDLQVSAVPGYRQQESEILNRIIGLEDQLPTALPDSLVSLKARLAATENELTLLEARLRQEDPRYAEVLYPVPLSSDEVRLQVLQPGEILLEYSLGREASYLWVLSTDDVRMVQLAGGLELEDQVRQLLPLLNDYNVTGPEAAWYVEPARNLHRVLLEPVAKEIESAERLIVCADGILHYLPFEALLTKDTPARSYGELPWLVQEKIVTYSPSASVLGKIRHGAARVQESGPWLLVGDPELISGQDVGLFARAAGAGGLPPLPFAGEELRALAALAPSEILAGNQATAENLAQAGQGQDLGLVHFASHGLFNEARPRYSGLVLSRDPGQGDDGFLSISEVLALDLDCDQVVLSACASALGPHVTGDGLVGLTRSFMFAGARSVVSALWDVSGREASRFMEIFYRGLAADSSDRALKLVAAKRAMIAQETDNGPDPAHPVFWAAFVLSGDGH